MTLRKKNYISVIFFVYFFNTRVTLHPNAKGRSVSATRPSQNLTKALFPCMPAYSSADIRKKRPLALAKNHLCTCNLWVNPLERLFSGNNLFNLFVCCLCIRPLPEIRCL